MTFQCNTFAWHTCSDTLNFAAGLINNAESETCIVYRRVNFEKRKRGLEPNPAPEIQ